MFNDAADELPEDEEERIEHLAKLLVNKYGMGTPSILILETIRPMAFVGGELGRILLTPWLPLFGDNMERAINDYITTFAQRDQLEKLVSRMEELIDEENKERKSKKMAEQNDGSKNDEGILKRFYNKIIGK